MEHHEREFFICQIRLGIVKLPNNIEIRPPTLEQELMSRVEYQNAYEQALSDDVMPNDELEGWMYEAGLWDHNDEADLKRLEQDQENAKIKIYESRKDKRSLAINKHNLKSINAQIAEKQNKKSLYYHTSCEGLAETSRINWLISNTTYKDNKLYDFEDLELSYIMSKWYASILSEYQIRELCLYDPWKSLWNIQEKSKLVLFPNVDKYEITFNQKHLIVWSQIYDNLQEATEPPTSDVIEDHDILDGWFIVEAQKRKREQDKENFEKNTNSKISGANEVFLMANSEKEVADIYKMNDTEAKNIVDSRARQVAKAGKEGKQLNHHEFADEVFDQKNRQRQAFKDKFKRS